MPNIGQMLPVGIVTMQCDKQRKLWMLGKLVNTIK